MTSLLTLLDDIATTFDDVAVMTKVALKKTSAIMTDDLAVNSNVVHGVKAQQELFVVWKIFLGSLLNKIYSIASVVLLMYFWPFGLKILLTLGGLYLCFEGGHKVCEKITKIIHQKKKVSDHPMKMSSLDQKIKGAIRTDLVLSIEIIVIAQSTLEGPFFEQLLSLCVIGILASIIIYGLVALLVKIDDLGLFLTQKNFKRTGLLLVQTMPYVMRALSFIGTAAMFLVGGGIFHHVFHVDYLINEHLQNFVLGFFLGLFVFVLIDKMIVKKT